MNLLALNCFPNLRWTRHSNFLSHTYVWRVFALYRGNW